LLKEVNKIASLADQLKNIEAQIKKKIQSSLKKEVSETSKDIMVDKLDSVVYSQYTPTQYSRSYDDGGLADEKNIETKMIDDTTLRIENIRKDEESGRLVTPIVETGKGYYTEWLDELIGERPFIKATAEELRKGKARDALKRGLIREGLNVK